MTMVDSASLFRLDLLDDSGPSRYRIPNDLPTFPSALSLPSLDEHAAGTERILAGLNRPVESHRPASPSRKGKERAVEAVSTPEDQGGLNEAHSALGDIWESLGLGQTAGPSSARTFERLKTWDTFGERRDQIGRLLSEQPALINALEQSDSHKDIPRLVEEVVLPRDPEDTLRTLLQSTLGTTTSDSLIWDKRDSRFRWVGRSVDGRSHHATHSATRLFLETGTAIRRMEVVVDTHSTTPLTPTHHAFLHAISTYLTYLKQELSRLVGEREEFSSSWHAEMTGLKDIHDISAFLCESLCWPIESSKAEGLPARASSLLSHLYAFLLAQQSTTPASSPCALTAAYLLSQSSGPFLDLLHAWLGLRPSAADEDTDPTSQPWADLGITRTALASSDGGEARWSYDFSSRKMPGFIPKESRRPLFEAGRSLRMLREASLHQHPLCATNWQLEAGWGWDEAQQSSSQGTIRVHLRRVKKEIEGWRHGVKTGHRLKGSSSMLRLDTPRKERKRIPAEFTQSLSGLSIPLTDEPDIEAPIAESELLAIDPLWAQFSLPPGSHLTSTPNPLWAPSSLDSLRSYLASHSDPANPILPFDSPSLPLFVSSHLLKPLLEHGKLISTSLVSLYLEDLALLDHYDILRSFFLAGDPGFAERVSAALFGKDEAGAGEALGLGKRARTRARLGLGGGERADEEGVWGIALGLGLSERARWPPGGAELAYALRTTLVEDDEDREGPWEGIADRISFAVRSLPEDDKYGERARWLDPQAIEALDFLYLSYSAPTSITPLLPTSLMVKYQSIQNLLLRVGRVRIVVRSLYIDTIHQTPLFDEPVKQGIDSGSRPASRTSSRQERVVQTLFPEGEKASFVLHRLRFRMSGFVSAFERYLIDIAIGTHWEPMYRKLDRLKRNSPVPDTRPSTPVDHLEQDDYDVIEAEREQEDGDSNEEGEVRGIIQLQSIDSVVVYHQLIMDRILRSCLLSPSAGYQVTYKVLMGLFGCVLDLGKIVKEMERGVIGWMDGAEKVQAMAKDWEEREGIFLHALERLSLRTSKVDRAEGGEGDERDLELLLGRDEDEEDDSIVGADGGDLGELLIRLKFGSTAVGKGGRWREG